MKINLAKSSGFCFGVKRALRITRELSQSQDKVYMLGDIVHNEDVVREIKKAGIKNIKRLTRGKDKTLLICAHGASAKTFKNAHKLGFRIVDATCPMVKEIHKTAQTLEKKGYKIIVIGDKKHDEVLGIIGQLQKKAIVIDSLEGISFKAIQRIKRCAVVVQSTQHIETVLEIVKVLNKYIKELKFVNTICQTTRSKQEEIKKMSLKNEVMVIIGSRTSANTKRLYEISKLLNKKSCWVQSKKELKPNWFKGVKSVGIASGASTPDSITRAVINQIRNYS